MPPGVRLTATPPAGDTTRYDVEFHWTGWDYDGEVDHFEYYIDPPVGILTDPNFPDTLSWTTTDAYEGRFIFAASGYDTTTIDEPPPGQDYKIPQVGLGYHVFLIRAVDDLGEKSPVKDSSWVAFTAGTICPRSRIISPRPRASEASYVGAPQEVGKRVTLRWTGVDPDGIFSDKPSFYLIKRVEVPGGIAWTQVDDFVLADPAPWDTLEPGVTQVTLTLDVGRTYGIAVRAVDEAHSAEPLLVLNRNLLWVRATEITSFPRLEVRSSAFGNRSWQGWAIKIEDYEVPLGSLYEFTLVGDADAYGGLIAGYSYAWNLRDVESTETNPTGEGAWTPWSTSRTHIVADFSEDRVRDPETGDIDDQYLFVRCKDDGGAVTLAVLRFRVVALNPVYRIAYVDDWELSRATDEATEDALWRQMLAGYDYGAGWENLEWDVATQRRDRVPTLEFLSQFECVVYSYWVNLWSQDPGGAYYEMNKLDVMNVLGVYLGSSSSSGERGKLWLFGQGLVHAAVLGASTTTGCQFPYKVNEDAPPSGCAIAPGTFLYDFLHIRGHFVAGEQQGDNKEQTGTKIIRSEDGVQYLVFDPENGPAIADTNYVYDPEVHPEQYARLPLRLEKRRYSPVGVLAANLEVLRTPYPDAKEQHIFFEPGAGDEPGRPTGLVPLYRLIATDRRNPGHNRYCAFRYIPQHNEQGEVVYFFFRMYDWEPSQARLVAKAVLTDMFGFPDPDQQ